MIRFLLLLFHQGNTEKPGKILMVVIKIALDSLWACKAPSIIDVIYKDKGILKRHFKVKWRLLWMICKREILHPDAVKHWSRLGIWCYASWITQLLYKGFPNLLNLWDLETTCFAKFLPLEPINSKMCVSFGPSDHNTCKCQKETFWNCVLVKRMLVAVKNPLNSSKIKNCHK